MNSINFPGHYYDMEDYPSLLPSCPRIVDPANPAHNVLVSGLTAYKKFQEYQKFPQFMEDIQKKTWMKQIFEEVIMELNEEIESMLYL